MIFIKECSILMYNIYFNECVFPKKYLTLLFVYNIIYLFIVVKQVVILLCRSFTTTLFNLYCKNLYCIVIFDFVSLQIFPYIFQTLYSSHISGYFFVLMLIVFNKFVNRVLSLCVIESKFVTWCF